MHTMRVLLCLALLLCAICSASSGKPNSCCTQVSPGKPKAGTVFESFIIQKEDLPCVHAVMFITSEGNICSTPSARWVKLKIQEIKKKNREESNSE